MKIMKKIAEWITNILLIIVVIAIFFALYGFIQLKIMNKTYINYFGYTFFEVVSGSMSPTINTHDLIIVKIDNEVKETWQIPSSWRLISQMPFGKIEAIADEKDFEPLTNRFKIFT